MVALCLTGNLTVLRQAPRTAGKTPVDFLRPIFYTAVS